jgi:shikimate dehydrogenase
MIPHAAVVGSPISHSLSPVLHRAAYLALGLNWTYEAIEQTVESFPDFFSGLDSSWRGLSVTMPLKEVALASADEASDVARKVGAANTLIQANGEWRADNTDVMGVRNSLRAIGVDAVTQATILGGGATARSAFAALADLGARSVTVCVRRPAAGEEFREWASQWSIRVEVATLEPTANLADVDVLIATVPFAAADSWAAVAGQGALLDVSYHPWPTVLSQAWTGPVASGRDLLLWQAVEQVQLMTGMPAPFEEMATALNNA